MNAKPTVGEIYDVMNPAGWQWSQLTTGERSKYGTSILVVLNAIDALGYGYVAPEAAEDTR